MFANNHLNSYITYYADQLDPEVSKLVRQSQLNSEEEAKRLLAFIQPLCEQSAFDTEEGKIILNESADTGDAEKAALAILSLLENNGYGELVDEWHEHY